MSEQQIKQLYKLAIQYGKHNLTDAEKETFKTAIDHAKTIEELLLIALATFMADNI